MVGRWFITMMVKLCLQHDSVARVHLQQLILVSFIVIIARFRLSWFSGINMSKIRRVISLSIHHKFADKPENETMFHAANI